MRLALIAAFAAFPLLAQPQGDPGPKPGEQIPQFEARDQHGKTRTFDNLKGPNGLMLLFVRSADW